ncbi:MAG: 16S rRNA (guanine(527)-N(7))-methyltransferase RsmG [Lentisphaeria bacterium]|nr:16S rRNA (guanine(527)-N(7))-methyltransferase RsmG [Lentisphaeria bacterium]
MDELLKIATECQVADVKNFTEKIDKLYKILIEYNKNVNLTRITEYNDFLIKHVIDSLVIAKFFPELSTDKLSIADIGCGAGFPSLVLAIAFPNLKINAIDSIAKKTGFVQFAADELDLKNIRVITGRSKEMNFRSEYKFKFDIVTARAVAKADIIYQEAKNFPKKNGRFILYKTPAQLAEDLPAIRKIDRQHNWKTTLIYELPGDCGSRQFLYY